MTSSKKYFWQTSSDKKFMLLIDLTSPYERWSRLLLVEDHEAHVMPCEQRWFIKFMQ